MISALISALALGQSLLSGHLLSRRIAHSNVYWPLALFFFVNAIAQLCFIIREPIFPGGAITFLPELTLFKLVVELNLPPLLWIYVRELTSTHSRGWRKSDVWHFVIPVLPSICLATIIYSLGISENSVSVRAYIEELNEILNIAALGQFCVYVGFIMKRLAGYRRKLMDLFASTENLELNWFRSALLVFVLVFLLEVSAEVSYALYGISNPHQPWNGLVRLFLVWFFSVWGLRQRPDLRIEISKTADTDPASQKYERSALKHAQLVEVAEKIRVALEQEKGFQDPGLSLRTLSKKINVLPNYVSQALNVEMQETFFDYVNRLRVLEAITQLTESDDTVLAISSKVGFNSRSSFYTAFKKVTGQTPSAYRKEHSLA